MKKKFKKYLKLLKELNHLRTELYEFGIALHDYDGNVHIVDGHEQVENMLEKDIQLVTISSFDGLYNTRTALLIDDIELFYLSDK